VEERQKSGGSTRPRKPIRAPDESVIKRSIKTEQERAEDAAKFSGRPLKPGEGNHFHREQYKRKDTGAPQPWDAAQRVTKKVKEYKESTEGVLEEEKKVPKAKSGCLGAALVAIGLPAFLAAVFAELIHLR